MNSKTQYILEEVSKLYIENGIKNITMDFVAEHLGMSKKTLYQYFSDKEKLVEQVLIYYMNKQSNQFAEISNLPEGMKGEIKSNAIEKLYSAGKIISSILSSMPASVINDLQKFYPEVLHKFVIYKREHILTQIKKNLKEGVVQGLYRNNLNIDIASRSYLALSESMLDGNYFPAENYKPATVFNELFMYHIRSIASAKGYVYIEKHISKFK